MSGWLAIARLDGGPVDREDVERCRERLRARGPHGEALVVDGSAALGLTVLDTGESVPTAREPVRCGRLIVTGHALITARDEAARTLGLSPVELAAASDLELLARALERWGEDVPARVFGEYAAAAWDAQARRLLVVRDAVGVRPAYVAHLGGFAIASNTLDAVRAHPAVSCRLDDEALLEFLLHGSIVGEGRTPFADVRLSRKGGAWIATPEGAHSHVAWTLKPPSIDRTTPWRELAMRWRAALDVAVADRLRGAKASLSLSGGLDSTAIAASAARLGTDRLYAFTDIMSELATGRDQEGDFAALAARHLGIRHEVFVIGKPPSDEPIAWTPIANATPAANPLNVPEPGSVLAMAAHGPVHLHGEGGDEIWRTTELTDLLGLEPPGALLRGVVETLALGQRPALGLNVRGHLKGTRKKPRLPPWLSQHLAHRFDLEALLADGRRGLVPRVRGPRAGSLKGLGIALWQSCFAEYDEHGALGGYVLRLPLLDPRVVNAALSLPPLPGTVAKLAVRHAMGGRLPQALLTRAKTPLLLEEERYRPTKLWARLPAAPELAHFVDVARLQSDVAEHGASPEALRAIQVWRWLAGRAP
ncbi:MAG: hypothetical protein HYS27_09285 [Deltaproteobacteria bacterium]|nr:hypothetical protein [Deltaproteobacteria bacterium]